MAFDESKDNKIWEGECDGDRDTKLTVIVASYNEGPPKVGINRTHEDEEEGTQFRKLGRLSAGEFERLMPFLQEALVEVNGAAQRHSG